MVDPKSTGDRFERLPKVGLHVHLEGAIPIDTMWELIEKYGGDKSVPDITTLKRAFVYQDFAGFIKTWMWKNTFLREYEDFTVVAEAVAKDLARQNIRYAEVFFSAPDFRRRGLKTQEITAAIRKGLERVKDTEISLVADLVRDFGAQQAHVTLAELEEVKTLGIVGIGIGGSEQDYPPEPFAAVFEMARQMGFRTSAHAGEAAGPESVWGAIRCLRVDRIGHGVRAIEDEELVNYLLEHHLPVEMCPLSNVKTGVVASYDTHPVRRFFKKGMFISINTDDPMMFGNSLAQEYRLLVQKKGFSIAEIKELIFGSIEMSWLPAVEKRRLKAAFSNEPVWNE